MCCIHLMPVLFLVMPMDEWEQLLDHDAPTMPWAFGQAGATMLYPDQETAMIAAVGAPEKPADMTSAMSARGKKPRPELPPAEPERRSIHPLAEYAVLRVHVSEEGAVHKMLELEDGSFSITAPMVVGGEDGLPMGMQVVSL